MQLRRIAGISLLEIVVVIGIIGVLGALTFSATAPAREKARQAVCAQNLHQLYLAHQLYTQDHPSAPRVPDVDDMAMPEPSALRDYLSEPAVLRCPNTPAWYKTTWNRSLYLFPLYYLGNELVLISRSKHWIKKLEDLKMAFPVVRCRTHDRTYYFPRERDLFPESIGAFILEARLDGSIFSGRIREPRVGKPDLP